MDELSTMLLAFAAFVGVFVLVESKLLKAVRLGKAIVGEFTFKKTLRCG